MKKILKLRNQIDDIDDQILNLMNTRTKIAVKIARIKQTSKQAIETPQRENEILNRIKVKNKGPFPNTGLERIYQTVFKYTKTVQKATVLNS